MLMSARQLYDPGTFAEFDVPWRNSFVKGGNPIRNGEFFLSEEPAWIGHRREAIRSILRAECVSVFMGHAWTTNFSQDSPKALARVALAGASG